MTDQPDTPDVPIPDQADDQAEVPYGTSAPVDDAANGATTPELPDVPVDPAVHAQVVAERDGYLDSLQRLKAEFDNYRKRVERDRQNQHLSGVRDLCGELLPVVDNLERALASAEGADIDQIVVGVEMVRGQLAGLLGGRGVHEIDAHTQPFDPNVHEAVANQPTAEHAEGTVIHVLEKGYRIGELVIRPAKVVVAASPPPEERPG